MRLTNEYKWKRTVEWLRLGFLPDIPVKVRRVKLVGKCGDCSYEQSHFDIRINKADPFRVQLDTLIHEWAHALSWFTPGVEDHSGEWGLAYARIYSAYVRWNFGKGEE
jgi:hypothetical protein